MKHYVIKLELDWVSNKGAMQTEALLDIWADVTLVEASRETQESTHIDIRSIEWNDDDGILLEYGPVSNNRRELADWFETHEKWEDIIALLHQS